MDHKVPHDPVFDDYSLDGVGNSADSPTATPADILALWRGRDYLPPACLGAVAAILAREAANGMALESGQMGGILAYLEQSLADTEGEDPRRLLQMACICHAAGRWTQAEAAYRQALAYWDGAEPLQGGERQQALHRLAGLLEHLGRTDEAKAERMRAEAELLLAHGDNESLLTVRYMACELFAAGNHRETEQLCRGLLAHSFEPPGTMVHLARALLMQDRLPEARAAIAKAWKFLRDKEMRQATPAFVPPRLFFFRILCTMLARGDHTRLVVALKQHLLGNPTRSTWATDPVLDHFEPYLRPDDFSLLAALARAINSTENLEELNGFPVWNTDKD